METNGKGGKEAGGLESIKMTWTLAKGGRYQGIWGRWLTVKRMGWPGYIKNRRKASGRRLNQGGVLTRTLRTMRNRRMMMRMMGTAPHTKYAFHLCSDVPALCSHLYLFRCIRHSMNHREQFSLSVVATSETIFRLCVLCCPLSVGVVPQRRFPIRFYQHDSLRFRCLHLRDRSWGSSEFWISRHHAAGCARGTTTSLVTTAKRQTIGTLMRATSRISQWTDHCWSDCSGDHRDFTVAAQWQRGQYLCWGNRASPTGTCRDEDRQRSHSCSVSFTDADLRQNSWNIRIISESSPHLVTIAWQISSESLRESTCKLMSTSANQLDGVNRDNDESGVLCLMLYVTTSHCERNKIHHWVTNGDTSAEKRLQLTLCVASAMSDEVINDDCHGMWGCVHLQFWRMIVSDLKRITSSNEGWIWGGVWGIVLHNPWLTHHSHLFTMVSVHSLLLFSAPITCAITMTALIHLHGSCHTEKGHLLYTCAPDIIKCQSDDNTERPVETCSLESWDLEHTKYHHLYLARSITKWKSMCSRLLIQLACASQSWMLFVWESLTMKHGSWESLRTSDPCRHMHSWTVGPAARMVYRSDLLDWRLQN